MHPLPSRVPLRNGLALLLFACALLAGCRRSADEPASTGSLGGPMAPIGAGRTVRIAYLHHSTGEAIWKGGVAEFIQRWNEARGTDYRITAITYPATTGGWPPLIRRLVNTYPWANYPYDYWNLWVKHTGSSRDRGEWNLDDLVQAYDVIVLKHCFPVSRIHADTPSPSVSSEEKTLANYRLQYNALKKRLHEFPRKQFIVWTGAALPEPSTSAEEAQRARQFFDWVKVTWDDKGDNIFVWDFHELETDGGLYLRPEYAAGPRDAHPAPSFAKAVAPLVGKRIVDVIEGRGDEMPLAGRPR